MDIWEIPLERQFQMLENGERLPFVALGDPKDHLGWLAVLWHPSRRGGSK